MKTTITVALFCTVLFTGINAFTQTTSKINQHNIRLNNAIAMMERTR